MDFKYLNYEVKDGIAWVTIDRPPVNALNRELVAELNDIVDVIEDDVQLNRVRVVVLTAQGKYFSAGADLKERMDMPESEVGPTVKNIGKSIDRLARISVPTIAAMQGSAMGGGFEVALAADIRILADNAQVGLRETALAIIPGAGGTQRLTRLVGPSNAVLWITSAKLFTARDAQAQGAVNDVVAESGLESRARELAELIAANGPLAVRQAKRAIVRGMDLPLSDGLEVEFACYENIIPTQDRLEGLQAFKEKRSPVYRGE